MHSVCTRCVHALGLVQGRVLGLVVAGRFWCSYAWVSLTQTAPVRPRGCLRACVCACVCVCTCTRVQAGVRACVRACAFL